LVLGGNTLYGTTSGGFTDNGTLFKVNTDGTGFAIVHSSADSDWIHPNAVILSDSTLYGTTDGGVKGTVFKVNTDGSAYAVLKAFATNESGYPRDGLVLGGDTLYGATAGTVFKINTNGGDFAVIHTFPNTDNLSANNEGDNPAALVLEGTTLYGTALDGGTNGTGTLFRLNTDGSGFSVLHTFSRVDTNTHTNSDGAFPRAALVLSGEALYGTASAGGAGQYGTVFKVGTNGSGFTVLHDFPGEFYFAIGFGPWAGLTLRGNTLYGTAENDANSGCGTVFKVNTDGSGFARLYSFSADYNNQNTDGGLPLAAVVFSGNTLYGTAAIRGPAGRGTVFSLQLPDPNPPPVISAVTQNNGVFGFSWSASPGSSYQVQYKTEAGSSDWSNLGEVLLATNETLSTTFSIGPDAQRFYRVALLLP
jgi:uncharacterized repeat protein (TIGR03803 family)